MLSSLFCRLDAINRLLHPGNAPLHRYLGSSMHLASDDQHCDMRADGFGVRQWVRTFRPLKAASFQQW